MTTTLTGKRVLVVEDEYFIASDLKRTLQQQGAVVVGPVGNLDAGLTLAEEKIDVAVLDVNLESAMSYPIAERLQDRGIPYMFLTGYDSWSLPAEHRDSARLAKPFTPHAVLSSIETLIVGETQEL